MGTDRPLSRCAALVSFLSTSPFCEFVVLAVLPLSHVALPVIDPYYCLTRLDTVLGSAIAWQVVTSVEVPER